MINIDTQIDVKPDQTDSSVSWSDSGSECSLPRLILDVGQHDSMDCDQGDADAPARLHDHYNQLQYWTKDYKSSIGIAMQALNQPD